MADDPGGGQPFVFGSRYAPLASTSTSGNQGKGKQKRSGLRPIAQESQFMKQVRLEGQNGPRFLILQRTDAGQTMAGVSPFLIKKTMDAITTNVEISRIRDGTLLLKTVNKAQADKLLKQTMFGTMQIKISEHPTLNSIKGTIYCMDLISLPEATIQKELADAYNVIDVKRIKRRSKDGKLVDTAIHILTFNSCNLPESIDAGFHKCKVKLYVPSPLRCMNCLRFGHKKDSCKGNSICANCSNLLHPNQPCRSKVTCASCGGDHHTLTRTCPVYLDEFEIQRIRTTERLSINDARRKRRDQVPSVPVFTKSYAQIASTRPSNNSNNSNNTIQNNLPQGPASTSEVSTSSAHPNNKNQQQRLVSGTSAPSPSYNNIQQQKTGPATSSTTTPTNVGALESLTRTQQNINSITEYQVNYEQFPNTTNNPVSSSTTHTTNTTYTTESKNDDNLFSMELGDLSDNSIDDLTCDTNPTNTQQFTPSNESNNLNTLSQIITDTIEISNI